MSFFLRPLRVMLLISGVSLMVRYYQHDEHDTIYDNISHDMYWALARIPNIKEVISSSSMIALINISFESHVNALAAHNPIAKAVIRDAIKVPVNIFAWLGNNELGHTHIKYDEGNVYGSIAKITCKLGILGIGIQYFHLEITPGSLELPSRISNYICESLPRFFALMSIERQEQHATDISYFTFIKDNISIPITVFAVIQGGLKTFVSDSVGHFFGSYGLLKFMKNENAKIDNGFLTFTGVIQNIAENDAIFLDKIIAVYKAPQISSIAKLWIIPTATSLDFTCKVSGEIVVTSLMATPTRMIEDTFHAFVFDSNFAYDAKMIWHYISNYFTIETIDMNNKYNISNSIIDSQHSQVYQDNNIIELINVFNDTETQNNPENNPEL